MNESTIKVLIGDNTAVYGVALASRLRDMGLCAFTRRKSEEAIVGSIVNDLPDAVVIDLALPDSDAMLIMNKVKKLIRDCPKFIIISDINNSFIERQVVENGAAYFLPKPFEPEDLCSAIKSVVRPSASANGVDIEIAATEIIQSLGVPAHVKGYQYLRLAIICAVEDWSLMDSVTKLLYPMVAARFNTASSRVERAIRHAIELAWDRGNTAALNSYFGYSVDSFRGRPTNSEFIALVADKLRLDIEREKRCEREKSAPGLHK